MEGEGRYKCYCCGYEKVTILLVGDYIAVTSCPRCQHLSIPTSPSCGFSKLDDPPILLSPLPQNIVLLGNYVIGFNTYTLENSELIVVFCHEEIFHRIIPLVLGTHTSKAGRRYIVRGSEVYRELVYSVGDRVGTHVNHIECMRIRYQLLTESTIRCYLVCTKCREILSLVDVETRCIESSQQRVNSSTNQLS